MPKWTQKEIQEALSECNIDTKTFDYFFLSDNEWIDTPFDEIIKIEKEYKNQIYKQGYVVYFKFKKVDDGERTNQKHYENGKRDGSFF